MRTEQIYKINGSAFENTEIEGFYIDYKSNLYTDTSELDDDFEQWATINSEVIYYSNAIQYLANHDPSLHESLEKADELGYRPKDLSSDILATLLCEDTYLKEYYSIDDDDKLVPVYHSLNYDLFDRTSDLWSFIEECYQEEYLFEDSEMVLEGFDEWSNDQDEEDYPESKINQMRDMLIEIIDKNNTILDND